MKQGAVAPVGGDMVTLGSRRQDKKQKLDTIKLLPSQRGRGCSWRSEAARPAPVVGDMATLGAGAGGSKVLRGDQHPPAHQKCSNGW